MNPMQSPNVSPGGKDFGNRKTVCDCPGLDDAIERGVKSMEEKKAPNFVINDFIADMYSFGWAKCKCGD